MAAQDPLPLYVRPDFGRAASATANFTPGGSYVVGDSIGGVIAVNTGRASTLVRLQSLSLVVPMASNTAPGANWIALVFGSAPQGTIADGDVPTWTATDTNLIKKPLGFAFGFGPTSGTIATYTTSGVNFPVDVTTDADGKLYFVLLTGGTVTWGTPGSARFTADYLY